MHEIDSHRTYTVPYRLDGAFICNAGSAEDAQDLFNAQFAKGLPALVTGARVSSSRPRVQRSGALLDKLTPFALAGTPMAIAVALAVYGLYRWLA